VENKVKVWHGALFGATHAATWTSALWLVSCAVMVARPETGDYNNQNAF
jgi:hypothetical protein